MLSPFVTLVADPDTVLARWQQRGDLKLSCLVADIQGLCKGIRLCPWAPTS